MDIAIQIAPILQEITNGQTIVKVTGVSTFKDVLDQLEGKFPGITRFMYNDGDELNSILDVYINGKSIYPGELAAPVHEGDEVSIIMLACFPRS